MKGKNHEKKERDGKRGHPPIPLLPSPFPSPLSQPAAGFGWLEGQRTRKEKAKRWEAERITRKGVGREEAKKKGVGPVGAWYSPCDQKVKPRAWDQGPPWQKYLKSLPQ